MKTITAFYSTMNGKICSPLFLKSKLGDAFEELFVESLMAQTYLGTVLVPSQAKDTDIEQRYNDALCK